MHVKRTGAIVSQTEFARLRGVSRQTVAVWKRQGRLALAADGKVDVKATEKLLKLRPETYRGGTVKAKPAVEPAPYHPVKGSLRKQEFEVERGELVKIKPVPRGRTRIFEGARAPADDSGQGFGVARQMRSSAKSPASR
jgi:hypothetical protein